MSIALRYSGTKGEAEEILNDAFYKVFSRIDQYDSNFDFKIWFRTIIINTSIDHFRKYKKFKVDTYDEKMNLEVDKNEGWKKLVYEDILKCIQLLPPSYRLAFNMYAIEGFKHHEIATKLNISVGTSKSNYAKARKMLQTYLKQRDKDNYFRYGG
ncbi:MAG: RNA polymerase sigma factor [Bacteroidetes bacterium]|nr:RNA polymerase sigma factor [Bacteroidota bacterium]